MSTIGSSVATLADWAKTRDPDGKTADIVEVLSQTNEILEDMMFKEGNLPTGHQTTVRTGLPSVYWRLLNQGVQPSKSTSAQITEGIGMLEAWSEVDKDLAHLNGDVAAFRFSEATAFLEAMSQEMASTVFYGNSSVDPEEFNGLSVRYADTSAAVGQNIVDAAGSGSDNSSIWFVCWGEQTCHGIFPKGSLAGLEHEDLGLATVTVTAGVAGQRMRAYQERYCWKAGLALRDWRYVVRVANIDISNLVAQSSGADLLKLMTKAYHRIPNKSMLNKCSIYMNRTVIQELDIQRFQAAQAGGGITYENVDGREIPYFRGMPIRVCDALTETESAVS